MMWNCDQCGCQNIAPDLGACPQCFKPKDSEPPAEPSDKAKTRRKPSAASTGSAQVDLAPQGQTEGDKGSASDNNG